MYLCSDQSHRVFLPVSDKFPSVSEELEKRIRHFAPKIAIPEIPQRFLVEKTGLAVPNFSEENPKECRCGSVSGSETLGAKLCSEPALFRIHNTLLDNELIYAILLNGFRTHFTLLKD